MSPNDLPEPKQEERLTIAARHGLLGISPIFRKTLDELFLLAPYGVTVLIEGETGTGKELFARCLHALSKRHSEPFVGINCAALPHELAENELFGHERGAYTNAFERQLGLVSIANRGTLFLDEIASLDLRLQAKLLRFLQSGEFKVLGSPTVDISDTRIVEIGRAHV